MENEELIQLECVEEMPPLELEEPIVETSEETVPEEKEDTVHTDEDIHEAEAEADKPKRRPINYRPAMGYFAFLLSLGLCGMILLICAMQPLQRWLAQFESVQPQYMEQDIYDAIFADPDWGLIYDLAGVEGTKFEGKDAFIAYMQQKTAGKALRCDRISLGISDNRKYNLVCDDEVIATFTMTETNGDPLHANWVLDAVEVFFTRREGITITVHPNHTVCVNGVVLDDSYVIGTTDTVAEKYLSDGLHADRTTTYQVDGFLLEPHITVTDRNLKELPVFYNRELDLYSTNIPTTRQIRTEELAFVRQAAELHALFAVRGCNVSNIRKHFNPNASAYAQLTAEQPFCNTYKSHAFYKNGIAVTDFYSYSDDLFSVRVRVAMDVTTKEGKTLTYKLDTTYFVSRMANGNFTVSEYMDVDLTRVREKVRLTYVSNGEILQTKLVRTTAKTFSSPEIVDKSGNAPIGWGTLDEDGQIVPILTINKKGKFVLAGDPIEEPLTLYPIFPE